MGGRPKIYRSSHGFVMGIGRRPLPGFELGDVTVMVWMSQGVTCRGRWVVQMDVSKNRDGFYPQNGW